LALRLLRRTHVSQRRHPHLQPPGRILEKALRALERQRLSDPISAYEVVVVDDGSSDDTVAWLRAEAATFPHVRLIEQDHGGPAEGRNRGVENAQGDVIVFIDSDLVVTEGFLLAHATALQAQWQRSGHRLCFTYGAVINTANFEQPTSEPHKLRDLSWAYFATGNVAIDRHLLERSGLFDTRFRLYGWEEPRARRTLAPPGGGAGALPGSRWLPLASGPEPGADSSG
jgi:glycosyltransferase involved in cell wall biosynthesis